MEKQDNIEDLFRDRFENFEADVSSGLWENISEKVRENNEIQDNSKDSFESKMKERFDAFEPSVNSNVWQGVQSQIAGKVAAGAVATSSGIISSGMLWLVGIVSGVIITGGVIYSQMEDQPDVVVETTTLKVSEKPTTENQVKENNVIHPDVRLASNGRIEEKMPLTDEMIPTNKAASQQTLRESSAEHAQEVEHTQDSERKINRPYETTTSVEKVAEVNSITNQEEPALPLKSDFENYKYEDIVEASALSGESPLTVNFGLLESCSQVKWKFSEDDYSNDMNPTFRFDEPGTYTVEVIYLKSSSQKPAQENVIVEVLEPIKTVEVEALESSKLEFNSNVFTPNNDGVNEICKVNHANLKNFEMTIRDINGTVVFESNNPEIGWNGIQQNGRMAPVGTYYVVILGEGIDGHVYQPIKKFVSLMR